MPKRRGIIAKGSSDRRSAFLMVATPMTESDVPATKLAVAEKHMLWTPLASSLVLASYHAAADHLYYFRPPDSERVLTWMSGIRALEVLTLLPPPVRCQTARLVHRQRCGDK